MQFTIKSLLILTAAVAILASQLPVSQTMDVAPDGTYLYSLRLPNPRFWGVAVIESLLFGWYLGGLRRFRATSPPETQHN